MGKSRKEPSLVLTLDAGGSGIKATVLCTHEYRILSTVYREVRPARSESRRVEFDPQQWWAVIQDACSECIARANATPEQYLALTCSAMRSPFILLDRGGQPVAPGVLNLDTRGYEYLAVVRNALGGDTLYMLTGHWPAATLGLPKLLWFKHCQPALWARVRYILQMHDWILYMLCGKMTSEPSSASMSQLVDIAHRRWAVPLLEAVGISPELFPPLRNAGDYLGGLKPDIAQALGLLPGTPVHVGGGDTHVCCLGVDGAKVGDVVVVGGSTTPIQLTASTPLCDPILQPWVSAHLWPDRWALEMNAGATGLIYTWLRDLCSSLQLGTPFANYELLDSLAAQSPIGARDLLLIAPSPHWGEQAWSRNPPMTILGLTMAHTLGDIARAILEAICYAVRANLERLETLHGTAFQTVTVAGGAGQSVVWSQMLADILGKEVCTPLVPHAAAVGGMRLILKKKEADLPLASLLLNRYYEPDVGHHTTYQSYFERYLEVHQKLGETFG